MTHHLHHHHRLEYSLMSCRYLWARGVCLAGLNRWTSWVRTELSEPASALQRDHSGLVFNKSGAVAMIVNLEWNLAYLMVGSSWVIISLLHCHCQQSVAHGLGGTTSTVTSLNTAPFSQNALHVVNPPGWHFHSGDLGGFGGFAGLIDTTA